MNPDKTQITWLGSKQRLVTANITPLHLHDSTVITPSSVHNLGVVFDSELSMSEHENKVNNNFFLSAETAAYCHRPLDI